MLGTPFAGRHGVPSEAGDGIEKKAPRNSAWGSSEAFRGPLPLALALAASEASPHLLQTCASIRAHSVVTA